MTSLLVAAQDSGALIAALTALVTAAITGLVSVLNWVQRARESGAKAKADEAERANIATQAALDGLRETYRQGLDLLNTTITSQQTQITAQQNQIGQLEGQLKDCREERHSLAEENRGHTLRIEELERKMAS